MCRPRSPPTRSWKRRRRIEVIVCITEGIPVLDMLNVKAALRANGARLIGPTAPASSVRANARSASCPASSIRKAASHRLALGTLTYEAVHQTTRLGLGQSTCVGIGGDRSRDGFHRLPRTV